jgi:CO/xanthine dehydrogenase FAD-binding subunit
VHYYRPESLPDAVEHLKETEDARILAGGQSMMPLLRQDLVSPEVIVDISEIPDLDELTVSDGTVRIGALVTYSELLDSGLVTDVPMLRDALQVIGDVPVRNAGTVGGGVAQADPAQDLPPALQCYEATVVTDDGDGTNRHDITDFFLDYYLTELASHEIITGIEFELPPEAAGGAYANDAEHPGGWSNAGVAALVVPDADGVTCRDARLAYCAGAPVPTRVPRDIEERLVGERIDREAVDDVAMRVVEDLTLVDDVADDIEYRKHLFRVMTKRALSTALERSAAPAVLEARQ